MASTIDFPGIQPGIISALLFIFLDIFTVGILDIVLARIVCLAYYRNINDGKPVSVKSADIPGLSNYLLGHSLSWINIIAIATKLALLGIVLTANISISSKEAITKYVSRDATFVLSPSDEHIQKKYLYTVRRRLESSKSCFEEKDNEQLTYYALRFNLVNGIQLPSDYGKEGINETDEHDVNDSTVICMSPSFVEYPVPLINVKGCTRIKPNQSCLSVVSREQKKKETGIPVTDGGIYKGEIVHKFRDYDEDKVKEVLFKEYKDPKLTCLSTQIGINSNGDPSSYTHCLMVSFDDVSNSTIVERWILGPDEGEASTDKYFIMEYPGIIFQGHFEVGREASARYLELPFPFTDYRTLSGELIAQASDYRYIGNKTGKRFGELEIKENVVVTTVDTYAVALVAGAIVIVLVALLVTVLLLQSDKRPRFNTINGLSSIVREEHTPSGRSYQAGQSAILGLKFTQDDRMHFGPLKSYDEGTAFQDGYDIS